MINIAKLLKNCPKGTKLYSPLFGEVKFKYINNGIFGIVVEDSEECCRSFDKYGRYFNKYNNAECLLFPSKDCRTWEGWKVSVEPKLKVGDWVVFNNSHNSIYQISEIRDSYYVLTHTHGGSMSLSFLQEEFIRPWTIADAKDGDILSAKIDGDDYILIFKQIKDGWIETYGHYYITIDKFCAPTQMFCRNYQGRLYPATQEQYRTLFKKMHDDGYEWDFDKNELKKIPVKPKFKVGDSLQSGSYFTKILSINLEEGRYYCDNRIISFENQDLWHLVPKPHYNIANFHAGMPVLVRDSEEFKWLYTIFGIYNKDNLVYPFVVVDMRGYAQCIPFNDDTKHLLGTTDMCPEEYINW